MLKRLQLKTSRDRILVLGPHLKMQPRTRLSILDLPCQERSSRVFFEKSPIGVRTIAFEGASPGRALSHPVNLPQTTHERVSTLQMPWFYSTASLLGVKEIVPCERYIGVQRNIIGLLLRYSDGHEASLGQVRLDCLAAPKQVIGHTSFWLGFSADRYGRYVVHLELSRGAHDGNLCWVEIRYDDSVDWWFSYHHSDVFLRK